MQIELPIYYQFKIGEKPQLIGMNWYRNTHYQPKDKVKKHYHALVRLAIGAHKYPPLKRFYTGYTIFMDNAGSDPSNVVPVIEKFFLDALKECNVIAGDSAKYHAGSRGWECHIDKANPRIICGVYDAAISDIMRKVAI